MPKTVMWATNASVMPYDIHTGEFYKTEEYLAPIPESMEIEECIYTKDYYSSLGNHAEDFVVVDKLEYLFEEFEELTDVEKDILDKELFGSDSESDSDDDMM